MRHLVVIITVLLGVTEGNSSYASSDIARGKILVANEALSDSSFSNTVVLIVGHGNLGTLGLIINRPLSESQTLPLPPAYRPLFQERDMYSGGPIKVDGFRALVASNFTIDHAIHVEHDIYFLDNPQAFNYLLEHAKTATRTEPLIELGTVKSARAYSGISSWIPGQLKAEIRAGAWYVLDSEEGSVFSNSDSLWQELITRVHAKWVDGVTHGNSVIKRNRSNRKKSMRDVLQPTYNESLIGHDLQSKFLSIVTNHPRNRMF